LHRLAKRASGVDHQRASGNGFDFHRTGFFARHNRACKAGALLLFPTQAGAYTERGDRGFHADDEGFHADDGGSPAENRGVPATMKDDDCACRQDGVKKKTPFFFESMVLTLIFEAFFLRDLNTLVYAFSFFLKLYDMKRITFFILILLCATACNNEIIHVVPDKKGPSIELHMPDAEVAVYSAASEIECRIDSIWVIEYDNTSKAVNYELIKGAGIVNNGRATQLLPQLSFEPTNSNTIVCIANCDCDSTQIRNSQKSNINTLFAISGGYPVRGNALPLYGELIWANNTYICEMTRAVAKIQVQMGTTDPLVSGDFTAENVRYVISYGGSGGFIQPTSPLKGKPSALTPFISDTTRLLQNTNVSEEEKAVYLYEYPTGTEDGVTGGPIPSTTFQSTRQHILLVKEDNAGNKSYYRLDFYDPATKEYIDTKRNHHYIFTIRQVRSGGYSRDSEAQAHPGSNIEYTLVIKDGAKATTSNGQYAIVVSADTVYVPAATAVADSTVAQARYLIPEASIVGDGGDFTTTVNEISVTSANPAASISLGATSITGLTDANRDIKVTTTNAFQEGTITFRLGNITHHLYVKAK
jgi:hypothetical protein